MLVRPVYLSWDYGSWSLNGVLMNIGENEDGNNTDFYGLQVGYHTDTRLGAGNYRAVIAGSGADFISSDGTRQVKRSTLLLSFDQAFGSIFGGWFRFGWRFDDSAANYDTIYSGGIDLKGAAWGRGADNIGIGYALLNGGNQNVDQTDVAEIYYRWQASGLLGLTADIQYMNDDYKTGIRHSGWIYGLRATAEF